MKMEKSLRSRIKSHLEILNHSLSNRLVDHRASLFKIKLHLQRRNLNLLSLTKTINLSAVASLTR